MWQEFPNFKTNTVNLIFIQNNETVIILTLPHTVKAFFLVHLSFILPDFKKKDSHMGKTHKLYTMVAGYNS